MIDKEKILDTVTGRLKNLPVGHYLNLRTYKRNRSVIIVKQSENNLLIIEDGFSKKSPHNFRKAEKIIDRPFAQRVSPKS